MTKTESQYIQVQDIISLGMAELDADTSKKKNSIALMFLVERWGTLEARARRLIGIQMIRLIGRQQDVSDELALSVFRKVGTPVCTCPAEKAVPVLVRFLDESRAVSVNAEAMRALTRLARDSKISLAQYESAIIAGAKRFQCCPDPSLRLLSDKVLSLFG